MPKVIGVKVSDELAKKFEAAAKRYGFKTAPSWLRALAMKCLKSGK